MEVVVIVLGDLGRSPRMQYHVRSLLQCTDIQRVRLIGYAGEVLLPDLAQDRKLLVQYVKSMEVESESEGGIPPISQHGDNVKQPHRVGRLQPIVSLLRLVIKTVSLCLQIILKLLFSGSRVRPSDQLIMVQNPPSIPVMLAIWALSFIPWCRFRVMIDWHNLGFSLYEQQQGYPSFKSNLAKQLEHWLGKKADLHICVSQAMKQWLAEHFGIVAHVLYDRPQHKILSQLKNNLPRSRNRSKLLYKYGIDLTQLFSQSLGKDNNEHNKLALVVTATSWTADEDFNLLLQALVELENVFVFVANQTDWDQLTTQGMMMLITGKGSLRSMYENKIAEYERLGRLGKFVVIRTSWLAVEDYHTMLSYADLGISLHTSSSGLDLPMKVVDLFGCGTPVCAFNFPTIKELVQHDENGLVFNDGNELYQQLRLLLLTREGEDMLIRYRNQLHEYSCWEDHWKDVMVPLLQVQ